MPTPSPKRTLARSLLFSKIFYFFFFAAMAALSPFLALYYEQVGLSGRQIGLLVGIPPLVALFSAPLFGGLADATQQHRLLLNLAIVGSAAAVLGLFMATTFFWLIPVVIAYALFLAPIPPLVDNAVLDLLADRQDQYGKLRLWGAVGWGLAAPIVGLLVEQKGLPWAFYSCFLLLLGLLATSFHLPVSHASIGTQFWRGLRLLLTNWQWAIFLFVVFIGGAGLSIVHNYLFLYLNGLGASKTLMGLSLTVATVSELTVMFFSDRLLGRWGTRRLLILSLLAFIVRAFAYAYVRNPGLVLVIQLLHGPTFAAMWLAGVAHANKIAPAGLGATAQGLFSGVNMGLGAAFGAVIGGLLYESLGAALMFQWAGIGMVPGLLFFIIAGRETVKLKPMLTKS